LFLTFVGLKQKMPITWRQPIACTISTTICTALAIWAVIEAPVPPAPGVSGLYVAAAVFVPLALWFGVWGSIAGYLSCVFMALYVGYSLEFALVWFTYPIIKNVDSNTSRTGKTRYFFFKLNLLPSLPCNTFG